MLAELQAFKNKHGHCDLKKQRSGLYELKGWLVGQHRKFRRGELPADHRVKLEQTGIVFESLKAAALTAWDAMFARLVAYKEKRGDCEVPPDYWDTAGLARWVVVQRELRQARKLAEERVRRLDKVGFVWDRKDRHWRKMYSALSQRLKSAGISGFESALQHDVELDKWVRAQQSAKKRGALSPQKQSALDKIGFPWEFAKKPKFPKNRKQASRPTWEDLFAKLAEFHKSHGHCDMKLIVPLNEQLHKWAQEQRQARQRGVIASEQVRQLDQLGFIWDTSELLWERMLKVLIAYKSVHGDCNVPRYWQQNLQLAGWVGGVSAKAAKNRRAKIRSDCEAGTNRNSMG